MDTISLTVTGRLGDAPVQGTTKAGKPWASFSLAVDIPARGAGGDREFETRWYKVWTYNALAEHVATSLVKGDRVTVRADDLNCRAWIEDGPDARARAQAELRAYDVAASMRFETLTTAKAARRDDTAARQEPAAGTEGQGDPWAATRQDASVPDVLSGVTR